MKKERRMTKKEAEASPYHHWVRGHKKEDGTRTRGYARSNPNETTLDNLQQPKAKGSF